MHERVKNNRPHNLVNPVYLVRNRFERTQTPRLRTSSTSALSESNYLSYKAVLQHGMDFRRRPAPTPDLKRPIGQSLVEFSVC